MANVLLDKQEDTSRATPLDDGGDEAARETPGARTEPAAVERDNGRATPLDVPDEPKPPAALAKVTDGNDAPVSRKELDEIKSYLGNLHNFLTSRFANDNGGGERTQPPKAGTEGGGEGGEDLSVEALSEKPAEALGKFFDKKMAPLLDEYRRDRIMDNYNRTKSEKGERWSKYEPKIAALMKQAAPADLAQPGAFEVLYKLAVAEDIEAIEKEAYERGRRSVAEADERVTNASLRPSTTVVEGKPRLTPVQKKIAENFGMSEDEYIKYSSR